VGYRAVLQNLRAIYKFKLPHLTEGGWLSSCHRNTGKKNGETPQPPGETKMEPLLKYKYQDWMMKE
jgi:hypothetical protein